MFKKVLVAEDHEMTNISVQRALKDFGVEQVDYVHYCDHACTWISNAYRQNMPYDLIITDIEFSDDASPQVIQNGLALIKAIKQIQPEIKVILFTAKDRNASITKMFKQNEIDGMVRKARQDGQYLQEALLAVYQNKTYLSPDVKKIVEEKNSHEFTTLDLYIVKFLYMGLSQKEMPAYLQARNIVPSSLSSIEKRLNIMKEVLNFHNNEQLVSYCKEMEII